MSSMSSGNFKEIVKPDYKGGRMPKKKAKKAPKDMHMMPNGNMMSDEEMKYMNKRMAKKSHYKK